MMSKVQTIHLFNCDQTYKFDSLEEWLKREKTKQGFSVQQHYFPLSKMAEMSEEIIPRLNMDLAVFVVHAHESRLSINEENAGIGYAKIYRGLLQKTGDNVIIVIGGDDNYRDEDEENEQFISRWARRKVSSQFNDEYMDGRKGFILSWNEKHREIHEETLRHFLDPSKRGTKFEYKPKRELLPRPGTAKFEYKPKRELLPRPGTAPAGTQQRLRKNSSSGGETSGIWDTQKSEKRPLPSLQSFGDSQVEFSSSPSEKAGVKGATSHIPQVAWTDPLHQSRHHSSSAAEPSHVRESYKSERRSVSPSQNYGNTQVEVSSSGSRGTQKKLIDLAVFGCSVSKKSIQVVKEVLGRLRSQLHISSQIIKHSDTPVEVKSCLLKDTARFCVLLVDAETVTDAYSNLQTRRVEYEDLLKTAADTVAEKVIVVIFAPCSLPSKKDEDVVKEAFESILLATSKGLVQWVEQDSITPEVLEEKILSAIRSQKIRYSSDSRSTSAVEHRSKVPNNPLKAHSSQDFYRPGGCDQDQYQSQQRRTKQPCGPPRVYRDFSTMKGFVMLKTRLRCGQISAHHDDVELCYPGFDVPPYIRKDLWEKFCNITEAEVKIVSDGNSRLRWSADPEIKSQHNGKGKAVQLAGNETVMLKTRLRYGQISLEQGDLEFFYPHWNVPFHISEELSAQYGFFSNVELYIISDKKEHVRYQVTTFRKDKIGSEWNRLFKR